MIKFRPPKPPRPTTQRPSPSLSSRHPFPQKYYHRRHLKHTFFSDRFSAILRLNFAKFQQNFSDFSEIWKSWHLSFQNYWNSAKFRENPLNFDEKTAKSAASSENQQKMHEILQKWCKGPEKSQKSGMVQRQKCRAWKMLKNTHVLAKIGVDTAENEPSKVSSFIPTRAV